MALITCPECGKEVSDIANVCPHCGAKVKKQLKKSKRKEFINKYSAIFIGAIFIVAVFIVIGAIQKERDDKAAILVSLIVEANHNIEEYKKLAITKDEDGKLIYNRSGAIEAIDEVSTEIFVICAHAEQLDECYDKSRKAVNQRLQEETKHNFFTWEDFREHLNEYCLLDNENVTSDEKAENLVEDYVNAMIN